MSAAAPGSYWPYRASTVADAYHRVAEKHVFAAPARDLVAKLALRAGALVLDVGCGTGAVTARAADVVGPRRVVALDPSPAMLEHARGSCACLPVAGSLPGLPFAGRAFDGALAGFVLSHVADLGPALAGVRRVLRPGARLAASAWRRTDGEAMQAWREAVARFVDLERIAEGFRGVVPWSERLAEPQGFGSCLAEAGFEGVEVEPREYAVAIDPGSFLAMRESGVEGVLARAAMGPERWAEYRRHARELFAARFPAVLRYTLPANLARATAP